MNLNVYVWSGIITGITSLAISLFVYFKNRKGTINKAFSLFTLSVGLWNFCWVEMIISSHESTALIWAKSLSIGSIFIPVFYLHSVYVMSNITVKKKSILIANYIFAFMLLFFNFFTNLFIKGVAPIFSFKYHIKPGPLYILHFLSFIIVAIYGEILLYKASKMYTGLKRNQIKYLFWAFMIGFAGGVTAYFPIYKLPMPSLAINTISIGIIIIAYAIVKYRLMDITVAITRTGIFVAVYTLLLGVPFAIAVRLKSWLIGIFGLNWWVLPSVLMAISATVGPFIYIYFDRKAEEKLLREQHGYQEILKQAAREIARIRNLKKLLDLIVHLVTKIVRISHSAIYLFNVESGGFLLKASRNLTKGQPGIISKESSLVKWFENHREPLLYEEIKQKLEGTSNPILKGLEEQVGFLNASVIVPGFLEGRLLGFLVLGERYLGRMYSQEDLNTFSVLASQAALAIENALLYENIEEQVRQRTEELVEVQKQLIQAEKLATVGTLAGGVAHEINNPLTAILTNVQMLLVSGGEIDSKFDRESLELIEEATKRCRIIVQKLMTYAKKPLEPAKVSRVDLLKVVQNVVSFLGYQLKQENIKIFAEVKKDSYFVTGNQNELEQVLTNIVLNAKDAIKKIKKSGSIYIGLLENSDWIKIEIKDEGAGIAKEIMPKIFDPFFTTKDVGKGVGLGLSICQAIIEKHKGLINVKSEPNIGTTFTVQLPGISERNS